MHLYPLQVLVSWTVKILYVPPLILVLHISHVDPSSTSPYSLTEELKLCLSGLYLSSHWKKKLYLPHTIIYRVLISSDSYYLSLPALTPPCTWEVNWVGYINRINKLIWSTNPQLSNKIMTLYYDSCFKIDTPFLAVCIGIMAFLAMQRGVSIKDKCIQSHFKAIKRITLVTITLRKCNSS